MTGEPRRSVVMFHAARHSDRESIAAEGLRVGTYLLPDRDETQRYAAGNIDTVLVTADIWQAVCDPEEFETVGAQNVYRVLGAVQTVAPVRGDRLSLVRPGGWRR